MANKSKDKTKEKIKEKNKAPIKMILLAIGVVLVFGTIMYFSFRYISHLNLRHETSSEAGPVPDQTDDLKGVDQDFSTDMYEIPDYSSLVSIGEYKGLSYEFDTFESDTYSSVKDQAVDHLLGQVIEKTTFKGYSQKEFDDAYAVADNNVNVFAEAYGMTKEEYLKSNFGFETNEDYEKYMKNTTIKYLKVKMVVVQIAKAENMTITDEDIAASKAKMMKDYGIETEEDFKKLYTDSDLQFYTIRDKVYDWLYENSTVINNSTATDATTQDAESD